MKKSLKTEHCFFHDTNFRNYPFVKSIRKEFGSKGYVIIITVLEEICRHGETVYDEELIDRVTANYPEISHNLVDMVVRKMVNKDFLDKQSFSSRRVLTPPSAYVIDTEQQLRDGMMENKPYVFIRSANRVYSEETVINSEETKLTDVEILK